ncbi:MAG: hypothetical protein DRR11_01120 [Gammaproteobacteria bacterium]|nr:MAG: hypothetical protein DRR11_01120 [Gammaproteobacteria bacterium]
MLNNIALGLLIFVALVIFYGIIAIHDIPYEISIHRRHPHQDAIHVAGWVSLFTLHILWPFLWIWATLYREDRGWGFTESESANPVVGRLEGQIQALSNRLQAIESAPSGSDASLSSGQDENSMSDDSPSSVESPASADAADKK